ncbi:hypothetical protein KY333_04215 [Candidatus Woesearchaeota archaeon]|nr:hypothetical protein [Candidatus Woesearchaeota archaeon]MBW2994442.1 hypothetical protein [Candidatus Woesearchaeota archaeon]
MTTTNLNPNIRQYNTRSKKPTATRVIRTYADQVIRALLSKDMCDILIAAEQSIDLNEIHGPYTQKILELQEKLNTQEPGLGSAVTKQINENLKEFGYFTAISIIEYLEQNIDKTNSEFIRELPTAVASISGHNGASKMMRYQFVTTWLPEAPSVDSKTLAKSVLEFVTRYETAAKGAPTDSDARKYQEFCKEKLDGNFDYMRIQAKRTHGEPLRKDLETLLRKLFTIDTAESLDESEPAE